MDEEEAAAMYAAGQEQEAMMQAQAEMDAYAQWEIEQKYKERVYKVAVLMHNEYEAQARLVGWKTQESCRVEFDNLPEANKKVMLYVAEKVIDYVDADLGESIKGAEDAKP
jgi:hypothetical protein